MPVPRRKPRLWEVKSWNLGTTGPEHIREPGRSLGSFRADSREVQKLGVEAREGAMEGQAIPIMWRPQVCLLRPISDWGWAWGTLGQTGGLWATPAPCSPHFLPLSPSSPCRCCFRGKPPIANTTPLLMVLCSRASARPPGSSRCTETSSSRGPDGFPVCSSKNH